MNDLTPEHKMRTLITNHRRAIRSLSAEVTACAEQLLQAAPVEDDDAAHKAIARLDVLQNSIRSRLLQIRAVKDVASTIGIKPSTLNQQTT